MLAGSLIGDGVTASLVRARRLSTVDLATGAFLGLAIGLGAGGLLAAAAPLAEPLVGAEVVDLARLAAPFLLITGIGAVSRATLQRGLAFRRLGLIEICGSLTTTGASLTYAIAGLDAEALILGATTGQLLATVLLLVWAPPPLPRHDRDASRRLLAFGLPNMGAGLAAVGSQNVDYLVLGARAPDALVGFYWRGYQLGVELQRRVSGLLGQLALPLYSRSASLEERRLLRSRIVQLQSLIIFPLLGGLILLAPVLVPAVFGARWEPAVPATQLLAVAGMIHAAQTGIGPLMAALGHPRPMLIWNLTNIAAIGTGVYLAAPEGVAAVAGIVVAIRAVRYLGAYWFLLRRYAGIAFSRILLDIAPAAAATAAMLAIGRFIEQVPAAGAGELISSLAVGAGCLIAYPLALRLLAPVAFAGLVAALARLLRRGPPSAPEAVPGPLR